MKTKQLLFLLLISIISINLIAQNEESKPGKVKKKTSSSSYQQKKAWSVGVFGGQPIVMGDVNINPMAYGYGLNIQKNLGHTLAIRANIVNGSAFGADRKYANANMVDHNPALNGINNPAIDYSTNGLTTYMNYKMNFTESSFQLLYKFDFQDFRTTEEPKASFFIFLGGGALLFDTWTDQLDASGALHDFNSIYTAYAAGTKTQSECKQAVIEMLDGDYETALEGNPQGTAKSYETVVMNRVMLPVLNGGIGWRFRLSDRLDLALESKATYTANDILDGQRWTRTGTGLTENTDIFMFTSIGLNIRLGSSDNIYWFDNPSAEHYKVTLENRRKISLLSSDVDNDGVSDYFDKDLNTPEGVKVDVNGMPIDSDNDGIPDYKDLDPFTDKGANVDSTGVPVDTDHDGVPDHKDLDNNTPEGMLVNFQGKPIGEKGSVSGISGSKLGFLPAIFFDFDDASLKTESLAALVTIGQAMKYNPNTKLKVIGYTDNTGSQEYNKRLGMKRAENVVNFIAMQGISKDRFIIESKGEADPLTDVKSSDANKLNRRVQFMVIDGGSTNQSNEEPPSSDEFEDIDE